MSDPPWPDITVDTFLFFFLPVISCSQSYMSLYEVADGTKRKLAHFCSASADNRVTNNFTSSKRMIISIKQSSFVISIHREGECAVVLVTFVPNG